VETIQAKDEHLPTKLSEAIVSAHSEAGKKLNCHITARRPQPPDEMLSLKDLAELQNRSSRRAPLHCKTSTEAHTLVCRIGHGHFPSAKAIQELVTAWKQLRKWR
jgi:hypothetical protein